MPETNADYVKVRIARAKADGDHRTAQVLQELLDELGTPREFFDRVLAGGRELKTNLGLASTVRFIACPDAPSDTILMLDPPTTADTWASWAKRCTVLKGVTP